MRGVVSMGLLSIGSLFFWTGELCYATSLAIAELAYVVDEKC